MSDKNKLIKLATREFIHIPGPNPILIPGDDDEWDSGMIECCNILKDNETYYLYYHGLRASEQEKYIYRIGVATAPHPLGPWTKHGENPILDLGSEGSWDSGEGNFVSCAAVLKERENEYYLWYSVGLNNGTSDIGLAYADNPLGPWKKYEGNPVAEGIGYLGNVLKVKGKYYMYSENPINASSPDQGPMNVAVADKPEGPWKKYDGNPILTPDDWGSWEDGGYSEASVMYHDGVFHWFYAGTKWEKLESIGYACSSDGFSFMKHVDNPVVPRERYPDAAAFAEIHALWEPPFYYLYNTLRYISRDSFEEDLGVQILATRKPFRLWIPMLSIDSLGPGQLSTLDHPLANGSGKTIGLSGCSPISLDAVSSLSLTVECSYQGKAERGLRVHVKSSVDGMHYDTEDL